VVAQTIAKLSISGQEKIMSSPKSSLFQNRRGRTWSLLQSLAPRTWKPLGWRAVEELFSPS